MEMGGGTRTRAPVKGSSNNLMSLSDWKHPPQKGENKTFSLVILILFFDGMAKQNGHLKISIGLNGGVCKSIRHL